MTDHLMRESEVSKPALEAVDFDPEPSINFEPLREAAKAHRSASRALLAESMFRTFPIICLSLALGFAAGTL